MFVHPLVLLGSVALGSGIGLWSQQAALVVIGAIAGVTGALLERVKFSIASPLLWVTVLTGCALAIILTWSPCPLASSSSRDSMYHVYHFFSELQDPDMSHNLSG
jgi:hypothetical protein